MREALTAIRSIRGVRAPNCFSVVVVNLKFSHRQCALAAPCRCLAAVGSGMPYRLMFLSPCKYDKQAYYIIGYKIEAKGATSTDANRQGHHRLSAERYRAADAAGFRTAHALARLDPRAV